MPTALEVYCSLPRDIIERVVVSLLDSCVQANDAAVEGDAKGPITRFHSKNKSDLPLGPYYARLLKYTPCSIDAVLLSTLYLARISRKVPMTPLLPSLSLPVERARDDGVAASHVPIFNSFTIHRLACSSLLVASKFSSDHYITQARAAKVAGVSSVELVRLEVEILKALDWSLIYRLDRVNDVAAAILRHGAEHELIGDQYGNFTDSLDLKTTTLDEAARPPASPPLVPVPSDDSSGSSSCCSASTSDEEEDAGDDASDRAPPTGDAPGESKEWREWKEKDRLRSIRARAESESSRHAKNLSIQSVNSIESF